MKPKLFRQGDVLIVAVDELPADVKPVARENGQVILAHGEVTGHAHAILDERAELVTPGDDQLVTADEALELYLLVHGDEPVELVHQEHDTIALPPGQYEVRRQREYAPEETRLVAD